MNYDSDVKFGVRGNRMLFKFRCAVIETAVSVIENMADIFRFTLTISHQHRFQLLPLPCFNRTLFAIQANNERTKSEQRANKPPGCLHPEIQFDQYITANPKK